MYTCTFITVAPFLMLSYLSVLIPSTDPDSTSLTSGMDTTRAIWYTFGTVRAFRWVRILCCTGIKIG